MPRGRARWAFRALYHVHTPALIEGYTHEEISGLLGIDAGTSKSQLSRARHALRSGLLGGRDVEIRKEKPS